MLTPPSRGASAIPKKIKSHNRAQPLFDANGNVARAVERRLTFLSSSYVINQAKIYTGTDSKPDSIAVTTTGDVAPVHRSRLR